MPTSLRGLTYRLTSSSGWSDEELLDHLNFDLQVRYALGIRDWQDEVCALCTVYYFRHRVSRHGQATREDLFAQAFAQVTDEQIAALHLQTGQQRLDSTQISSNIRHYSRLQLVLEVWCGGPHGR